MKPFLQDYFGNFGGQFVAEPLVEPLEELERGFKLAINDEGFCKELLRLQKEYTGRPSPMTLCERISRECSGANIYLKREDLNHTGAHKINNALGQALLAKRMGKKRIIAETGAGQHGVATATVCALLDLDCVVYMGALDAKRQSPNVKRMQVLGATVHLVHSGSKTLKDAINEANRDWITNIENTHYLLGSAVGPYPFPSIVSYFQNIIGLESYEQLNEMTGQKPDCVIACVGGGSNAIGMFQAFVPHKEVELIGVQAGGMDEKKEPRNSAPLLWGSPGVLHGSFTQILQDNDGQILKSHSIAPGLDYPGVGPEHSFLKAIGRVKYVSISDAEALHAFQILAKLEGIIPALESSHAFAQAMKVAASRNSDENILVCLSGRGDKDLSSVCYAIGLEDV